MILQKLYELAKRDGLIDNPAFEPKPVAYRIRVADDGRLVSIVPTFTEEPRGKKTMYVPRQTVVPFQGTRNAAKPFEGERGVDPFYLCDNAEYVFGFTKNSERADKSLVLRRAFLAKTRELSEAVPSDKGCKAVVRFLEQVASGEFTFAPDALQEKWGSPEKWPPTGRTFAFEYADRDDSDAPALVHDRPAVRAFLESLQLKPEGATLDDICLVTGQHCDAVDTHGKVKKLAGGQAAGTSLVSFDKASFKSYGHDGGTNAPISAEGSNGFTAAINRLLDETYPKPDGGRFPKQYVRLPGEITAVFWTREAAPVIEGGLAYLFSPPSDEAQATADMRALFDSIHKGHAHELDEQNRNTFYLLMLSPAGGRVTVRDWFEAPVETLVANLRQHFDDIRMQGADEDKPASVAWMLGSLALLGKSENVPVGLTAEYIGAIIRGRAYPRQVLSAAITRTRAEHEIRPLRAALIKGYLVREQRRAKATGDTQNVLYHLPTIGAAMDPQNTDVGYRLGRLMAVLERTQQDAIPGINSTVVDRFYGSLSVRPATVMATVMAGFQHNKSKLDPGSAINRDRRVQEILGGLSGIPSTLSLTQQGLFALGYYHEKQNIYAKKSDATPAANA